MCLSIMCTSASTIEKQGKYERSDGTITYAEFCRDIESITRISNEIFDSWQLKHVTQIDGIENWYLTKSETKFIELEGESNPLSCSFIYHVVYHRSYQVPCLGFNVYRQGRCAKQFLLTFLSKCSLNIISLVDGSSVVLNDIWNYFRKNNVDIGNKAITEIITEMDHPVLFTPTFILHPCRTAEILTSLPNR